MVRKRGAKLEEMIRELFLEHRVEIWPEQQEVRFERPLNRNGHLRSMPGNHVAMGTFYEALTMGLWGGRMTNRFYIPQKVELNFFEETNQPEDEEAREMHFTKPDVVHIKPNGDEVYWEAKATKMQSTCNLYDSQIDRYVGIQLTRPRAKIRFALYRHVFQGIKSSTNGRTDADLFRDLCDQTRYGLVLPLSVILTLHERGISLKEDHPEQKGDGSVYRYEARPNELAQAYPSCTVLRASLIDRFFRNPEQTIEDVGLDSKDYVVDRLKTPIGYRVDRNILRQIPIVVIKDRDYKSWLNKFREEKLGGVPF